MKRTLFHALLLPALLAFSRCGKKKDPATQAAQAAKQAGVSASGIEEVKQIADGLGIDAAGQKARRERFLPASPTVQSGLFRALANT